MFDIGDRVVIGGRTRLSPTISLVGVTGVVVLQAANAGAGEVTVLLDWNAAGYTDTSSLPEIANIPSIGFVA